MRIKFNPVGVGALCLAVLVISSAAQALDDRLSARIAAQWAAETGRPAALASSLSVLLEQGGSLDPQDPFSVADLAGALEEMPGGPDLLEAVLATRSRGQLGGAARLDLTLDPGQVHDLDVVLVAAELTWVEARLWRGSGGADIDVALTGKDGLALAADTGPQTGVEGVAALFDVWVDTCTHATLRILNAGDGPGRVALFVPQSTRPKCEAPG